MLEALGLKCDLNPSAVMAVWQRNALVWRKLALASLVGNVVDPLIALLAFGLGLGAFIPSIMGLPYLHYLAVGALCLSAMNSPSFEALYSAFSRMQTQKTWQAIINTPVRLREVVLGEALWAASKGILSVIAMMAVVAALGIGDWVMWLGGCFVLALAGLMFAAIGLCVNAHAKSYDFFMFYFTLFLTPQTFLSGAFFPRQQLPEWLSGIATVLPLSLVVDTMRALYAHRGLDMLVPLGLMAFYTAGALCLSLIHI
jgi:lipooligosaccharide transport system permease protein